MDTEEYRRQLLHEARTKGRATGKLEMMAELVSDGLISLPEAAMRLSMTEVQFEEKRRMVMMNDINQMNEREKASRLYHLRERYQLLIDDVRSDARQLEMNVLSLFELYDDFTDDAINRLDTLSHQLRQAYRVFSTACDETEAVGYEIQEESEAIREDNLNRLNRTAQKRK